MPTSKLSPEERLLRKRNAARIRQQRCRARKRQALVGKEKQVAVPAEKDAAPPVVGGALTGLPVVQKENVSPNQHPQHSPRSVYWNEQHGPPQHTGDCHFQQCCDASLERRYDSPTVDRHVHVYPRYELTPPLRPSPPMLPLPPPATTTLAASPSFGYYGERQRSSCSYTSAFVPPRQHPRVVVSASSHLEHGPSAYEVPPEESPWEPPRMTKRRQGAPKPPSSGMRNEEQAAVHAILSLKTGVGNIVDPPEIKRYPHAPKPIPHCRKRVKPRYSYSRHPQQPVLHRRYVEQEPASHYAYDGVHRRYHPAPPEPRMPGFYLTLKYH
eukprot:CAMPEP_0116861110 /NCGR_PEP_ID=MMETSP0418-20121206/22838_1 /TAXON_ID=1158023 /ORGANISM="Astrosyne radiata, Strain 13vi08-1A" /LENGTH=325 /DNA_ID=CAMNT_0004495691 /DNA_START=30 /DNA_END=1007 /DNA_ORIENTATION=-